MRVLEIMKTHVVKTTGDATLSQAADLLDLYQTTGLPVVDGDGVLIGVLTESDIVKAVHELSGLVAASQAVRDWMTVPPICVGENDSVNAAASLLEEKRLKRLPVVSELGCVVGVLNRIDLLQSVFEGTIEDVFTSIS